MRALPFFLFSSTACPSFTPLPWSFSTYNSPPVNSYGNRQAPFFSFLLLLQPENVCPFVGKETYKVQFNSPLVRICVYLSVPVCVFVLKAASKLLLLHLTLAWLLTVFVILLPHWHGKNKVNSMCFYPSYFSC